MKEVIEGKIFWRLNEKSVAYEAATAWYKVIPCNIFQNTNPIVFVLFIYLSIISLTVSKRVSKVRYFGD